MALITLIISLCVMFVALLTIIPIIHFISSSLAAPDRQKALQVQNQDGKTLDSFLSDNHLDLDDLHGDVTIKYSASFQLSDTGPVGGQYYLRAKKAEFFLPKTIRNLAPEDKTTWGAFFRLDIGHISDYVPKDEASARLMQTLVAG